jgi:hypothetical protein
MYTHTQREVVGMPKHDALKVCRGREGKHQMEFIG